MTSFPRSRTIRRSLLALACAAAFAAPMLAQEPSASPPPSQQEGPEHGGPHGRGGEMQQHQLEHMTKALNLAPDQVTQIKAIQDEGHQQMEALHKDTSTAGPEKHAKMTSLREAQEAKIKGVLNDDQKAKFDKMLAKQREHNEERHEHHDGRDHTPPPPPAA